MPSILDTVREFVNRADASRAGASDLILMLIDKILESSPHYECIWHPVGGFLHIPLLRSRKITLRLHAWTPVKGHFDRAEWPVIHTHIWHLESYVACGEILNKIYTVKLSSAPTSRIFYVKYAPPQRNHLVPSDELVESALLTSKLVSFGNIYEVPVGVFHSTHVQEDAVVCTLVRAVDCSAGSPEVLGPVSEERTISMDRHRCSEKEIEQVLSLVANKLRHGA